MKQQLPILLGSIVSLVLISDGSPVLALSCASSEGCSAPRVEDTMVIGCESVEPGSVGIETLLGNAGDQVTVAVSVVAANRIDGFMIDLTYPEDLLRFESAFPGELIFDWAGFSYNEFPGGLRFLGTGGNGFIENGESGNLATLTFTVLEPGCAVFCFLNLWDHILGYTTCESAPPASLNASFDVKPGRCPNRSALLRESVRSVIAGSNVLDVNEIDQSSVRLRVVGQPSPTVAPSDQTIMVTDQPVANECDCSETPPDGLADLVLDFSSADIRQLLASSPGTTPANLEIVGVMNDGTEFSGSDCLGVVHVESANADDRLDAFNRTYHVTDAGHVRLSLYDVSGRLVDTLVDAPHAAGSYALDLDSSAVPSGVYFIRFETKEAATSHKIVLVR